MKNKKSTQKNFGLSFDFYGRTHTELHKKLVQDLFTRLDKQGLIEEKTSEQLFSVDDNMFLADRFIRGTCPKCGYDRADGDQCGKCGSLLNPTDLINPYSAISGSHNLEIRKTKHLYFQASAMEGKLREWINSRVGWPKTAISIANKWLNDGLRDTPITRDLSWGNPC